MKVALCLNGYYVSSSGIDTARSSFDYIKKKILDVADVDVFVHSWDLEHQEEIERLYSPVASVFEKQKTFEEEQLSFDEAWFNENFDRSSSMYNSTIYKTLSCMYSRKQSIAIKTEHERQNGFEYDCVIMARFDLGNRGKEHHQVYYATNINFDPNLDMSHVYTAYWDQLNHGIADHWFYSNSRSMNRISELYDGLFSYYQKDSDYVKSVTSGWLVSNRQNEFSNELIKPKAYRTDDLHTFPKWGCIDNHKAYKWHMHVSDLLEDAKFVDITE
jgi:hypothetical protein